MKKLLTLLCCLLFTACSVLSPAQKASVRTTLGDEYAAGNITKSQYDAAIEALDNDKDFDWETLGFVGMNILLTLVGAPIVVRKMRGPPTQKVGLPANKIQPVDA